MSISYFNIQHRKSKPEFWLCKPDRTSIHKIIDSFDENLSIKFSAINELSFSIPVLVERNHKLIKNPLIDKIKERYLIRMKKDNQIEYFIILKINKQMDNEGFEYVTYQTYSLAIQLATKLIRDYEETSRTLSYLSADMLNQTVWNLDYVDAEFDLKHRSFEVSSANVLQCIFDIAEKFNAAVNFDTITQKISFHYAKNIGKNKGLRLKEGKFLESFNLSIDPENMVTRLKVYGQDGLDFRRLSPTGSNFIEDYSFFMFPFECDSSYNVIQSSNYMSDSLCIALVKYRKKLESLQGQFDSLTTQATAKNDDIQQLEQELSVLIAQRNDLLNQRDIINYTYGDSAPNRSDWQNLINQLNNKFSEITAKESQISLLKNQQNTIENQISQLRETVKVENNFTVTQIQEWNDFIIEREHYNDSITDDEDLLEEAYEVFNEVRQPPIHLTLSLDNFLHNIEQDFNKDKISIGDILTVKSQSMNVLVSAKITEITFNYESGDVSITLSNTTREKDDYSDLIAQLNIASNTSTTVNIDKYKWNDGRDAKDSLTAYINGVFDSAKQLIQGGLNNSVTLSERGLIAIDMLNKNNWLMIQNGQLLITPDNGNTVSVAINKDGVHAERLIGRLILGNKLHIEDVDGIVSIQNALMTVFDKSNKPRVHLGRYPNPDNTSLYTYGLRIYDGAIDIRTSDNQYRGIQFDGNGIRSFNNNGVRTFNVNAATGQVEIVGDLSIRTSPSTNKGVVIDGDGIKGYNASGQITFQINNSGNAWFGGRLESATGTLDNVGGTFIGTLKGVDGVFTGSLQAVNGTFTGSLQAASGTFQGLVTGSLSTETMKTISIDAKQITTGKITADQMEVNSLSAITADLGTVNAGKLNGVSIKTEKDVFIGSVLNIGSHYGNREEKRINFGGITGGFIWHRNDYLILGAMWGVLIEELRITGTLDLREAKVLGLN
ncbi:phage tail spike protein [Lysinibacillus sp. NPDC095746]|uniref:phage tail spike protein n=1 Tax=Lysinibacillus sp. NPDC095746 TaxID=3364134 RepID=UPI003801CEBB